MSNTGPPRANGGQRAPTPTPGEPAPNAIPQAGQATGPPPGAAPGEDGPSVPPPTAARNNIALLTGPFLSMGQPVSRNSVRAGFGVSRSWAASGGQGRAIGA
jgi:hypothetical protein